LNKIFEKIREHRKIKENKRIINQNTTEIYQDVTTIKSEPTKELECEEKIIQDKERFGRVRTVLMKELRLKYGVTTANRAMWRVSARKLANKN
jgi:hypothetical protein